MRFRILAVALVATVAIGAAALARNVQQGKFTPEKRQKIERRIVKELGLTNQQVRDLKPIVKKFEVQVRDVRKSNLPQDQKRTRIQGIRQEEKAAVSQRLSPEQMKKAEAMWTRFQRGHRMHRMFAQLNLTTAQKSTIKDIMQNAKAQAQAIKSDKSVDKSARQARFQQLRKDTRQHVLSVLTPDQRAKFDAMRKMHHA